MNSTSTAMNIGVEREFEFTHSDFEFLAKLAYRHTGIVLQQHKSDMVYGRVARRLRALQLTDVRSYCMLLESDAGADEMGNLVNALTTNLTSFFRESHHFEHLANHVLKPFAAQSRDPRLRIWSAGCSAGAEPSSICRNLSGAIAGFWRRILIRIWSLKGRRVIIQKVGLRKSRRRCKASMCYLPCVEAVSGKWHRSYRI